MEEGREEEEEEEQEKFKENSIENKRINHTVSRQSTFLCAESGSLPLAMFTERLKHKPGGMGRGAELQRARASRVGRVLKCKGEKMGCYGKPFRLGPGRIRQKVESRMKYRK